MQSDMPIFYGVDPYHHSLLEGTVCIWLGYLSDVIGESLDLQMAM